MGRVKAVVKHTNREQYSVIVAFFMLFYLLSACLFINTSFIEQASAEAQSISVSSLDYLSSVSPVCFDTAIPASLPAYPLPISLEKKTVTATQSFAQSHIASFCLTVPVLLYHHIKPYADAQKAGHAQLTVDVNHFENQVKYIVDTGYTTHSAEELPRALLEKRTLPAKPIIITVDDGYDDFYTYVFPILKKYIVKANLMIPTGLLEGAGYLTWSQLAEMKNSGLVYIYNHTHSHYPLKLGDAKKVEDEVRIAAEELEKHGVNSGQVFTYPYGMFSDQSIEELKRQGFVGAYTTIHSRIQCDNELYMLKRDHIGNAPLSNYGL